MNSTHAANSARLVALAAALLVTAFEWTGFSEIFLLRESDENPSPEDLCVRRRDSPIGRIAGLSATSRCVLAIQRYLWPAGCLN